MRQILRHFVTHSTQWTITTAQSKQSKAANCKYSTRLVWVLYNHLHAAVGRGGGLTRNSFEESLHCQSRVEENKSKFRTLFNCDVLWHNANESVASMGKKIEPKRSKKA